MPTTPLSSKFTNSISRNSTKAQITKMHDQLLNIISITKAHPFKKKPTNKRNINNLQQIYTFNKIKKAKTSFILIFNFLMQSKVIIRRQIA